jgi:hypothetical protein
MAEAVAVIRGAVQGRRLACGQVQDQQEIPGVAGDAYRLASIRVQGDAVTPPGQWAVEGQATGAVQAAHPIPSGPVAAGAQQTRALEARLATGRGRCGQGDLERATRDLHIHEGQAGGEGKEATAPLVHVSPHPGC